MMLFVFEDVEGLTDDYHDTGGCVVVAETLDRALELVPNTGKDVVVGTTMDGMSITVPSDARPDLYPVALYHLGEKAYAERVFIFPDAGCC